MYFITDNLWVATLGNDKCFRCHAVPETVARHGLFNIEIVLLVFSHVIIGVDHLYPFTKGPLQC